MEIIVVSPKFGKHIIYVDDEDYAIVSKYKWHINYHGNNVYATHVFRNNGKSVTYKIHRLILGFPDGHIDHIDGNGLNNQRANLRVCNASQNQKNKSIGKRNTSGYKGVCLHKREGVYQAQVGVNGKYYYSCGHKTAIDAAIAYNELAIKHHGEFAKLNVIPK